MFHINKPYVWYNFYIYILQKWDFKKLYFDIVQCSFKLLKQRLSRIIGWLSLCLFGCFEWVKRGKLDSFELATCSSPLISSFCCNEISSSLGAWGLTKRYAWLFIGLIKFWVTKKQQSFIFGFLTYFFLCKVF